MTRLAPQPQGSVAPAGKEPSSGTIPAAADAVRRFRTRCARHQCERRAQRASGKSSEYDFLMTRRPYRQCGLFARFGVDARSCSIIESRPIPLRVLHTNQNSQAQRLRLDPSARVFLRIHRAAEQRACRSRVIRDRVVPATGPAMFAVPAKR